MNKLTCYILAVLALWLTGCGQTKTLLPDAYVKYITDKENGYIQYIKKEGVKIDCLYKPVDYQVLKSIGKQNLSKSIFDSLKKEVQGNEYYEFLLYFDTAPPGNIKSFIDFGLENSIVLVAGKDTTPVNSYLAEPYNGVTPYQRILFSFPQGQANAEKHSVIIKGNNEFIASPAIFEYHIDQLDKVKLQIDNESH